VELALPVVQHGAPDAAPAIDSTSETWKDMSGA
jgi:hypothetical protein